LYRRGRRKEARFRADLAPGFSSRAKLSGLIGAIDLFELEKQGSGSQVSYRVRQRPKGAQVKKEV
jgi:hypothetical protein